MVFNLFFNIASINFNSQNSLARNTYSYIKHFLNDSDSVLDVGSGSGMVADLINNNLGIKVICIDIRDTSRVDQKPILFDGIHIPFKDNMFATVLGCFILHHAQNQKAVVEEMKRVTRSEIIILEDIPNTIFDRLLIVCHTLKSRITHKSMNMKFRTNDGWKKLFKEVGLYLKKEIKINKNREILYPVSRQLYLLSKYICSQ
jgi:ubiquinone/menaquinone biosynthesis C-methylase UbiE